MTLSKDKIKHLRQIGHSLKPVVAIGDKGLTDAVINEVQRALRDHELIKVKIRREDKPDGINTLCELSDAALVQKIGNIVLLYKENLKPDPKLSNLLR